VQPAPPRTSSSPNSGRPLPPTHSRPRRAEHSACPFRCAVISTPLVSAGACDVIFPADADFAQLQGLLLPSYHGPGHPENLRRIYFHGPSLVPMAGSFTAGQAALWTAMESGHLLAPPSRGPANSEPVTLLFGPTLACAEMQGHMVTGSPSPTP
jgi:hypothetical protein